MDKLETADLYDRAADILMVRGRTRGCLEDEEGRVCLVGAVCKATGRYPDLWSYVAVLGAYCEPALAPLLEAAGLEGNQTMGVGWPLTQWHDDHDRSTDEVHDLLRNTAKRLREEAQS